VAFAVKTSARLPHFDMTRRQDSLDVAAHALASSTEASDAPLGPRNLFRKLRACYRALRPLTRTGLAPAGSLQLRDARSAYPPASTTKRVRTKLSGTSSRFHGLWRQRGASTQSPYSVASITTTGVSLDENCARLRADGICSQHAYQLWREDHGAAARKPGRQERFPTGETFGTF
jgi:hypothetical protein